MAAVNKYVLGIFHVDCFSFEAMHCSITLKLEKFQIPTNSPN